MEEVKAGREPWDTDEARRERQAIVAWLRVQGDSISSFVALWIEAACHHTGGFPDLWTWAKEQECAAREAVSP